MKSIEVDHAIGDRVVVSDSLRSEGNIKRISITPDGNYYDVKTGTGWIMGTVPESNLRPVPTLAERVEGIPEVVELVRAVRYARKFFPDPDHWADSVLAKTLKPFDGIGE